MIANQSKSEQRNSEGQISSVEAPIMARGYLSVCLVGFFSMWHLVFILIFCLVRVYASASQVTLQQLYLLYPRKV